MMETPYVDEASASRVLEFEHRFLKLRKDCGVLFVNVEAIPVIGGRSTSFTIRLGIAKFLNTSTGVAIIQSVMKDEISSGIFSFQVAAYRGIAGP